jgi:hypothetical protein
MQVKLERNQVHCPWSEEISAIKQDKFAAKEAEQASSKVRKEKMLAMEEDRKKRAGADTRSHSRST